MNDQDARQSPQGDEQAYPSLTSFERGFSYQAAAARCDEVSAHLVRLAELLRCTRPDPCAPDCPLSESVMVKSVILGRRLRDKFFDAALFADPAWDILLDLYMAKLEQRRTSVSSLCIAARVPATTALRYINSLVERGMIVRTENHLDHRVVYVHLTEPTFETMRQYFGRFSELLMAASGR
jgi:DNA-binding MarR family transcriptional regulator